MDDDKAIIKLLERDLADQKEVTRIWLVESRKTLQVQCDVLDEIIARYDSVNK